jgi:CBS domain containing-hemolysin-like protein
MANATHQFFGSLHGLPDPERDRQFYEGVPSRRLVAWIVDVLAVIAMSIVVIPVVGLLTLGLAFFVAPLIFMALSFVYRTATLASRSATWGMRLMGIEFRRSRRHALRPGDGGAAHRDLSGELQRDRCCSW